MEGNQVCKCHTELELICRKSTTIIFKIIHIAISVVFAVTIVVMVMFFLAVVVPVVGGTKGHAVVKTAVFTRGGLGRSRFRGNRFRLGNG